MRKQLLRLFAGLSIALLILSIVIGLISRNTTSKRLDIISAATPGMQYLTWRTGVGSLPLPRLLDFVFAPESKSTFVQGIRFDAAYTGTTSLRGDLFPEVEYLELDYSVVDDDLARFANTLHNLDRIYVSRGVLSESTLEELGNHPNNPSVIFELCDFDSIDFDGEYVQNAAKLGVECVKHPRYQ